MLRNRHKKGDTERKSDKKEAEPERETGEGMGGGGAGHGRRGWQPLRRARPGREEVMDGAPVSF